MCGLDIRAAIWIVVERSEHVAVFVAHDLRRGVDEAVLGDGAMLLHLGGQKETCRCHKQWVARTQVIANVKATEKH